MKNDAHAALLISSVLVSPAPQVSQFASWCQSIAWNEFSDFETFEMMLIL